MNASEITITATLNIAGDNAGTKKCPREFSIPIRTAAMATRRQEREDDARQIDRQLDLSRHVAELRREQPHQRLGEDDAEDDDDAGDDDERVDDGAGKPPRPLAALERQQPCECRHKGRAHRAFREQVPDEIGNAAGDAKRVVGVARAEVKRQHLIADQPEYAARDGRQPEDPGGPGQAWRGIGHQ